MKNEPVSVYWTEIPFTIVSSGKEPPKPTLRWVTWSNTRSNATNPRWRSQVVNRREAGTSHTCSFQEHVVNPYGGFMVAKATKKVGLFRYAPPTRGLPADISAAVRNSVDAECIGQFRTRVQAAIQELSGPTFLGELRSTVAMIRSPARALCNSFRQYVRQGIRIRQRIGFNPGDRAKRERQLNRLYLSYTYGWTPLMSDIEGAVKALSNFHKLKSDFVTTSKAKETPAIKTFSSSALDQFQITTISDATATYSVRCYGKIRAELIGSPGSYERLKGSLGFSMREFIPTLWNLLPFSFVVDYFTNINELLLSDYSSSATLVYSGMTRVSTTEAFTTVNVSRAGIVPLDTWAGFNGSRLQKSGNFSRSVGIGVLIPTISLPGFKQGVNLTSLMLALSESRRR